MSRAIDRELERRQILYLNTTDPRGEWKAADLSLRAAHARHVVAAIAACGREMEAVMADPLAPGNGERFRNAARTLATVATSSDAEGWTLLDLRDMGEALAWFERQHHQGGADEVRA